MGSVGEFSIFCSLIVLNARIGRLDFLWFLNKFARAITKWTRTCDKRLARLISYIHQTCECKQHRHVGNKARQMQISDMKPGNSGKGAGFGVWVSGRPVSLYI